ncbi:MAG: hypothetical protein KDA89_19580 [Planctomycetaceae bacterium]|nr:hypothetical protein [Planctomycetaceae bacterium]
MDSVPPRTVSGTRIVLSLFAFGILATSGLWIYWHLHLTPFMPLQEALANEFENCSPRVDGGRRKSHRETPNILRVVMRVPFDPTPDSPETHSVIQSRLQKTRELAAQHTDLDSYDTLELHLYFEDKEQTLRQKTVTADLHTEAPPTE